MKKRILACLLALVMLIGVLPVMALAEDAPTGRKVYVNATKGDDNTGDGTQEHPYQTVGKALTGIEDNATVYLADGVYYAYTYSKSSTKESDDKPKYCKGQNVTFIGEGPGKTTWYIGTPWSDAGGETNGDYSFDGANSATFQNMTLKASMAQNEKEEFKFVDNRDWTGFIRINHTIVKDCVIEGRTAYWGYQSSEFINTVSAWMERPSRRSTPASIWRRRRGAACWPLQTEPLQLVRITWSTATRSPFSTRTAC